MIDFAALAEAMREQLVEALADGAETVVISAKAKAPVRKVFKGGRRSIRFKTVAEIGADRPLRRRLGLGPEFAAPPGARGAGKASIFARQTTRPDSANVPFRPLDRRLSRSGHHLHFRWLEARLSSRGRWELASGRAFHKGFLGGRLRDEIAADPVQVDGERITVDVVSPTPYAKYQEFGTRHNPAHPYLRPALHESASTVVGGLAHAVDQVARRGVAVTDEVIVLRVPLKVAV